MIQNKNEIILSIINTWAAWAFVCCSFEEKVTRFFAAFWCETALLIFMQAYKRERLEILLEQQYRDELEEVISRVMFG